MACNRIVVLIIAACMALSIFSSISHGSADRDGTAKRSSELWSISFPRSGTDVDEVPYIPLDSGIRAFITFQIKNDLASAQEFIVKLENTNNWTISFTTHTDEMRMNVGSGETNSSTMVVDAPMSGEAEIVLNASVSTKYVLQSLQLEALPASLSVSTGNSVLLADSGETVKADIIVRNNLPEEDRVTLSLSTNIEEGTQAMEDEWVVELSSKEFTLPGNGSTNVTLSVIAPLKAVANNKVVVEIFARSSNRDRDYTVRIDLIIKSQYGLRVLPDRLSDSARPGEEVQFNIEVENTGNDNIMVDAVANPYPLKWTVRLVPESALISRDGSFTFSVTIRTSGDSLAGNESVGVHFTSGIHSESITLRVKIEETNSFDMVRSYHLSDILYPGVHARSDILLTSRCNHEERLELGIENNTGTVIGFFAVVDTLVPGENSTHDLSEPLYVSNRSGLIFRMPGSEVGKIVLVLAPFQKIEVRMSFYIPGTPPAGVEEGRVYVRSVMGGVVRSVELKHTLRAAKLRISGIEVDGTVITMGAKLPITEGEQHCVRLTLENELNFVATDVTVRLSVDGNDVATETLARIGAEENGTVELKWTSEARSGEDSDDGFLLITVEDSLGWKTAEDTVSYRLTEKKEETKISMTYVIIALVFLVLIAGLIIYVIRNVKRDRENRAVEIGEVEDEAGRIDDFFRSERSTFYDDGDYESMGTGSARTKEDIYGTETDITPRGKSGHRRQRKGGKAGRRKGGGQDNKRRKAGMGSKERSSNARRGGKGKTGSRRR